MDQNNWFFYGIPTSDEPVYGLYEPVHDLFFLIHPDIEIVKKLVLLFSSRFTLHVCKISDARNYQPGLIDNTVCHNWTLSNKESFPITRFPDINRSISPHLLIENNSIIPDNFKHDQKYMMYICNWFEKEVPKLQQLHQQYINTLTRFAGFQTNRSIASLPGAPFNDKYVQAISSIESIAYSEFDVDTAITQVSQILLDCYA